MTRAVGTVLVIADDAVVGALVGLLLESAGYTPAFVAPNESPEQALARVLPLYAVLLDGHDPRFRSELFLARAARSGVRVAVFSATAGDTALAEWASARGVQMLQLPTSAERLQRALEAADPGANRRAGTERRDGIESSIPDAFTFRDAHGRTWRVFDRRGTERREGAERRAGWRTFVFEGLRRECAMNEEDFDDRSQQGLARQFARSLVVTF